VPDLADIIKAEAKDRLILIEDDLLFVATFAPRYRQQADEHAGMLRSRGKDIRMRAFAVEIKEANPRTRIVTKWEKAEGMSLWLRISAE
jgi:hypothetical protein